MYIADECTTTISPSAPRLLMEPTGSRRCLLDGAWWPQSTDPVAELPGLLLAIDKVRGPITRLVLSADGWDSHPRRLSVAGRVLRLGYFVSQPVSLLTAVGDDGARVDLLIVPPETALGVADAAMKLASITTNRIHAEDILAAASAPPLEADRSSEATWEGEGGQLGSSLPRAPDRPDRGLLSPVVSATP